MSSEGFRDRLRRLRRDEEPPPEPEIEDAVGSLDPPGDLVARLGEHGETVARLESFLGAHRHGDWPLEEIASAEPADFALLTGDEALAGLDPSRAVYLDTETTGLSGGAGTTVFLVGLGSFAGATGKTARFDLWQGFLREPSEERALLEECAVRIRDSAGVVSFFGKSFDRHRLEDKMRLHGVDPPFDGVLHLDLYHPLRRLYRNAYADGKLKTLEHQLCAVERTDDLPGSQAPAAWFNFLAGRMHRLEDVFRHNRDDVLSLVTLAAHLGRTNSGARGEGGRLSGDGMRRELGIVRTLAKTRRRAEAVERARTALALEPEPDSEPSTCRRELMIQLADSLRLERRPEEALDAYRAVVAGGADAPAVHALVQMAKLLGRRAADPEAARECCRIARTLLDTGACEVPARVERELGERELRLGH